MGQWRNLLRVLVQSMQSQRVLLAMHLRSSRSDDGFRRFSPRQPRNLHSSKPTRQRCPLMVFRTPLESHGACTSSRKWKSTNRFPHCVWIRFHVIQRRHAVAVSLNWYRQIQWPNTNRLARPGTPPCLRRRAMQCRRWERHRNSDAKHPRTIHRRFRACRKCPKRWAGNCLPASALPCARFSIPRLPPPTPFPNEGVFGRWKTTKTAGIGREVRLCWRQQVAERKHSRRSRTASVLPLGLAGQPEHSPVRLQRLRRILGNRTNLPDRPAEPGRPCVGMGSSPSPRPIELA